MSSTSFWKNKKVLITGHQGFLGSWLTKMLVERGARVTGIDISFARPHSIIEPVIKRIKSIKGDIADYKLVMSVIKNSKPAVIFHLAAEAVVGDCFKNPVKAFESNIEGTWNILEAARSNKSVEAVVAASSDKAYGICKELPYREDTPLRGKHPYDVSKSCADLICHTYFNTYGVPVCVTRCGNIFGPGDLNMSRIVPDAIRCALHGKTLEIRSDGKFTRDYVFVEDIANGYIVLAEKMKKLGLAGEAFNFSDENPITVLQLVKHISDVCGKKLKYKILNKAKYEIKHQYLGAIKARKMLGWKPGYTLKQGIKSALDWYGAQ